MDMECLRYLQLPESLGKLAVELARLNGKLEQHWARSDRLGQEQPDGKALDEKGLIKEIFEQFLADVKEWVAEVSPGLETEERVELATLARNFQLQLIDALYYLGVEPSADLLVPEPQVAVAA